MKKIVWFTGFFLVLFVSVRFSFAQEGTASALSTTPVLSKEAADYQLPYPGLLPDSPLYFFKIARDRIISFLISDPLKKAEFNLLQAEKRFSSGIVLVEKGREDLGETALSKSMNYLEEAITKLQAVKKQGQDAHVIVDKMAISIQKQQYIFMKLQQKAPKKTIPVLEELQNRLNGLEKSVKSLKS